MFQRKTSKHVVAICWDNRRFHFLVAALAGSAVTIRKLVSRTWKSGYSAVELADCVKTTFKESKVRKSDIIIGIARSQADIFNFDVPPSTDNELPLLVRTGVARQHGELSASDLIDYAIQESPNTEARSIAAALIRPETKSDIDQLCAALGEKPNSIVMRPFSVASLFRRLVASQKNCLVVNRLDDTADLLVIQHGQTVFNRSVRFESDQAVESLASSMSQEILRTLAAAPQDLERSAPIQRIFLFGSPEKDEDFVSSLEEDLSLAVTVVNPFEGTRCEDIQTDDTCPHAALIGMVHDFHRKQAKIDFANPKQPPKPPDRIRQAVFYSVAAVATLAILAWNFTQHIRDLRQENDRLQAEIDANMADYRVLRKKTLFVDEINRWRRDEVNWLDELRDLSRRFPNSGDAVVDRMTLSGTRVSMSVRVRDPSIVTQMESALRDHPYRSVSSKRISQPNDELAFPCQFETTLLLKPRRPKEEYLKSLLTAKTPNMSVAEVNRDDR